MRVLNVIDTIDPAIGGTATSVLQAASLLEERGHDVEIAVMMDRPGDPWIGASGAHVRCFGPARLRYGYAPSYRHWLRDHASSYDLVVIRGLWQYQGIATASEMWRQRRPYAIFIHGMLGPYARSQPLKYLKKFAYWAALESRVVSRAVAAVFTSEEEERLARDFFPRARWNPVVIGNSVDPPPRASAGEVEGLFARFPELRGRKVVLYLGRLLRIKGCDQLIAAFAQAFAGDENMRLVLAGPAVDSRYERELRRVAQESGVADRITWTGLVTGADRSALFSIASVYVSPSHHENFGFSAVEAIAFGLPVIVTNKVNIHGLLERAGAALVCPDTAVGIAAALRRWHALDATALDALRGRQLEVWRQSFSREQVGERLEGMFGRFAEMQPA